jgi:TolB-like protein/Tfp pilus assembly protein PilF
VTVLYVVAAWLLLQITDVLSSLLPVPEWTGSLVFVLLVIGLPPALIFAWVYEYTPEGLRRQKDVDRSQSITHETGHKINVLIVVLLVLAIGVVVLDRLIPESQPDAEAEVPIANVSLDTAEKDQEPAGDATSLKPPENSIAVLPFVNMSSDAEQEFFSDGLSEELLNLLAKVPDLRVAARTSSFSLKGKELQISEIGDVLKVAHVLEGSVRKSGDRLRITAQLIHAEDGYHLWSETYDRTLDDVFAIQDEIAAEVVNQLKVTLLGKAPKTRKVDPAAYTLLLQARHLRSLAAEQAWEQARDLYQQALAIEPDYSAAWSGLAAVYTDQIGKSQLSVEEGYPLAREAAMRAIAVDPENAEAHAQLGKIAVALERDPAAAARQLEKALALDPTDSDILKEGSFIATSLGRLDDSIRLLQFAVARDPVNAALHRNLGINYYYAGRTDKAIESLQTALTLSPTSIGSHGLLGRAHLLQGHPETALAIIKREPSDWKLLELPMVYFQLGDIEESNAVLAQLIEKYERSAAVNIAAIYAYRGEADTAFAWLQKAADYTDPGLAEVILDPLYANLHDDPRWPAFLESIGRSPQQLAAIDFEFDLPQ